MIASALNSIAYDRAKTLRDVTLIESEVLESVYDDDIFGMPVTESAKFSVLPSFRRMVKRYPELEGYKDLIAEADDVAHMAGGKVSKSIGTKIIKVIIKIMKVLQNISSTITLPFCILIFPITNYLLARLLVFAFDYAEFALVERELMNVYRSLQKVRKQTADEKVQKKLDEESNKVLEKIKAIREKNADIDTIRGDAEKEYKEAVEEIEEDDIEFADLANDEVDNSDEIDDDTVNDILAALDNVPDDEDAEINKLLSSGGSDDVDVDDLVLDDDDDEDYDIDLDDFDDDDL